MLCNTFLPLIIVRSRGLCPPVRIHGICICLMSVQPISMKFISGTRGELRRSIDCFAPCLKWKPLPIWTLWHRQRFNWPCWARRDEIRVKSCEFQILQKTRKSLEISLAQRSRFYALCMVIPKGPYGHRGESVSHLRRRLDFKCLRILNPLGNTLLKS